MAAEAGAMGPRANGCWSPRSWKRSWDLRMGPHLEIGSLQVELSEGSGDEVILDQLCHPRHWARPPYWNMVKFHRTEGNGDFSRSCVTWGLSMGPHLEIGSLWTEQSVLW
jgi:hypothetical protein